MLNMADVTQNHDFINPSVKIEKVLILEKSILYKKKFLILAQH